MIRQLTRFGLGGLTITVASAAGYWFLAEKMEIDPNVALVIVFAIFSIAGFFLHGWWSFSDHGDRANPFRRLMRYVVTSLFGLLLNQMFVLLLVKGLQGATWWPVVPMIGITPWITFALSRWWVFSSMRENA